MFAMVQPFNLKQLTSCLKQCVDNQSLMYNSIPAVWIVDYKLMLPVCSISWYKCRLCQLIWYITSCLLSHCGALILLSMRQALECLEVSYKELKVSVFQRANVATKAENFKGKHFMIVHGTADGKLLSRKIWYMRLFIVMFWSHLHVTAM